MIILGIETSCDETAAAVVQKSGDRIKILSNVVASSADLQAKYGGVIPEQAAREQLRSIIPVIQEALVRSNLYPPSSKNHLLSSTIYRPAIDAIAVTYGPGLIGSLLVGTESAKTLATVWKKPLIPVNHLLGHFYANWISKSSAISNQLSDKTKSLKAESEAVLKTDSLLPSFPCIGLLVSGGHTDLVLFKDHGKYEYLGGTRDDAAGECFDKCARLLNLPYPGGPAIARLARLASRLAESAKRAKSASKGNPKAFNLPRPMIDSQDLDFSFSGLKTAVANLVQSSEFRVQSKNTTNYELRTQNLCASIQQAIVDVLVSKTIKAVRMYKVKEIMIAGGVAANQKLINDLRLKINEIEIKTKLHVPSSEFCTDNAAMIASAGFFQKPLKDPLPLQANPNLTL